MVATFLIPADALAYKEIAIGGGGTGGGEGDPLDTNDVGGGGDGSDIHDEDGSSVVRDPLVIGALGFRIMMVPEYLAGKIVFRIVIINLRGFELQPIIVEGSHAP